MKKAQCPHPKDRQFIRVINTVVTCETTVVYCADCGEVLTEPKTDC